MDCIDYYGGNHYVDLIIKTKFKSLIFIFVIIITPFLAIADHITVQAQGLPGDSIYFQMTDTTGFSVDTIPDGGWRGIRFDHTRNTNPVSVIRACHFSFGKVVSEDPGAGNGGAISIRAYDQVTIENCSFSDNFATYNGGAISLDSADIIIHHCFFTRNRCGLSVAPWGYGGAVSSDNSSPDTSGFFLPEYDLAELPRIWFSIIDMGAYETVYEGLESEVHERDINVWPNPTDGKFKVQR
jgi:predicted outer membrane repeat protein